MLRLTVLLLLAANGLYFAWTHGYLGVLGWQVPHSREPQRLAAQIKPEALVLLDSAPAQPTQKAPTNAPVKALFCWQTQWLNRSVQTGLRDVLAAWPQNAYRWESNKLSERWIIYMGPYANPQALANKKTELRRMSIAFEALQNPELEPGISLGAFASKQAADDALISLNRQGIRTAKVSLEEPEKEGVRLLIYTEKASEDARLASIQDAIGKTPLQTCPAP